MHNLKIINEIFKSFQVLLNCNMVLSIEHGKVINKIGRIGMKDKWQIQEFVILLDLGLNFDKMITRWNNDFNKWRIKFIIHELT